MTYLSQRMREIKAEEARRDQPAWVAGIDWAWKDWEVLELQQHKRAEFLAGWPWGRGA